MLSFGQKPSLRCLGHSPRRTPDIWWETSIRAACPLGTLEPAWLRPLSHAAVRPWVTLSYWTPLSGWPKPVSPHPLLIGRVETNCNAATASSKGWATCRQGTPASTILKHLVGGAFFARGNGQGGRVYAADYRIIKIICGELDWINERLVEGRSYCCKGINLMNHEMNNNSSNSMILTLVVSTIQTRIPFCCVVRQKRQNK